MIGDDIRGDIEASQQAGLKAIMVRTGKFSQQDLELGISPDVILDSVAQLPEWWQSNIH
jgi:ribonucleotide monophosphatase NagD (HAD superfamily)